MGSSTEKNLSLSVAKTQMLTKLQIFILKNILIKSLQRKYFKFAFNVIFYFPTKLFSQTFHFEFSWFIIL